jgi:hypothetical protein
VLPDGVKILIFFIMKTLTLLSLILVSVLSVALIWATIFEQKVYSPQVYLVFAFAVPIGWCCYLHDSKNK